MLFFILHFIVVNLSALPTAGISSWPLLRVSSAASSSMTLLDRRRLVALVPPLALLSVVTSVALNTIRLRREAVARDRTFRSQREVLRQLKRHVESSPSEVLARSTDVGRQLARVGLKPSALGFSGAEVAEVEDAMAEWHRPLTWFEALFRGRKMPEQMDYQAKSDQEWEEGTLKGAH